MATVLVTGVNGVGGAATAKSLSSTTSHRVIGVDMDPTGAGFYEVDHADLVPPATDDEWGPAVAEIAERHGVDVIVPLVDEELARLPDLRAVLPEGVSIVVPRQEIVEATLDKYRLATVLESNGLSTPETWLADAVGALSADTYPVAVKPRRGRGSRDFAVANSPAELEAYLSRSDRRLDELVVQEFVRGTEYTTSVVTTKDDRVLSIVPKEVLEKRGNTVRGVTRRESDITDSCRRVVENLRPGGPLNVQQIVSAETGEVMTIEINPRFSSTACLTVAAGVDELDLLVRDADGESVAEPAGFEPNVHVIRHTCETFVTEENLVER